MKSKSLILRILTWITLGVVTLFLVSLLFNFTIKMMGQTEAIFMVGNKVEDFGRYFIAFRIVLLIAIVFYWKDLVRWQARRVDLNLRQVLVLKKAYPYVIAVVVINEIFEIVF